ncbi:hypothetical protein JCM5353_006259 [Sporobolomyces roseus]
MSKPSNGEKYRARIALQRYALAYLKALEAELAQCSEEEENDVISRVFEMLEGIRFGTQSFLIWVQEDNEQSREVNLAQHLSLVLDNSDELSNDLYASLVQDATRDPQAYPFSDVVVGVGEMFTQEMRRAVESVSSGAKAVDEIYVHLVEKEDVDLYEKLQNKKGYVYSGISTDHETIIQDNSFISFRILRLHSRPSMDLLLDADIVRSNLDDHWLLSHPSNVPLSAKQIELLNLSALHPGLKTQNPLILARINPGDQYRILYRKLGDGTSESIEFRKSFARGKKTSFDGIAVGVAVRNDQRGSLGYYSNYKKHPSDPRYLHYLHSIERSFIQYPLLVAGRCLPGLLAHERSLTLDAHLPPVSFAGTCTTASAHRGFSSRVHLEPKSDAFFTFCASYGSVKPGPSGMGCFSLPCVDNGKGIVLENRPGVVILWAASRYAHTQADSLIPFDETSPSSPEPSLSTPESILDNSTRKRSASSPIHREGGAIPEPQLDEFEEQAKYNSTIDPQDRVSVDRLMKAKINRLSVQARLADVKMEERKFTPVSSTDPIPPSQPPFVQFNSAPLVPIDESPFKLATGVAIKLPVEQQLRGSGSYTKISMLCRQARLQLDRFPGKGISSNSTWAIPLSQIERNLSSLSQSQQPPPLAYLVPDSGDSSSHDEQESGLGASVGLATLPISVGRITRSQTKRLRELQG